MDCLEEINKKHENFFNQNPKCKVWNERSEKARDKITAINDRIKQVIGKEQWEALTEKAIEELEEEYENTQKNTTQLQQEINNLKQEINELRNSQNPSSSNPNILQEKETQLRTKERELDNLKNNENDISPNNNKSNLPFYFIFAVMGVVIIFLTVLLIKKNKKGQ
ncbi:MAG: Chromosome partition protein Smc [Mycoplasmataceae bacterium]|nr:MAG: Chromosome partition protein Smc [Mycoplasmataceae bacterium]